MDYSQNAVQHRLAWSEPAGPNEETRYDHVIAPTSFGRIRITWKGWKEYDSPTVDEHSVPDFFYPGSDIKSLLALFYVATIIHANRIRPGQR